MGDVVSIAGARKKKEEEEIEKEEGFDFEKTMERNLKNKERLERERNNHNKSVKRSYRIRS